MIRAETPMQRSLLALACCTCIALPFLVVRFPPITDLPQQVAQIRLFWETLENPGGLYRIQWFTPYSLSYAVLGIAWALCPPLDVGRMAMLAIGVLWTVAAHLLAARRQRPSAAAVLASVLFFNHIVYWGFYSFAIGWPVFLLWLHVTTRPTASHVRWPDALLLLATALLLYLSHALWFAAGCVWLGLASLVQRLPLRISVLRLASISPVVLAVAVWYPTLSVAGFVSPTVWVSTGADRLALSWWVDAAFGGIRGSMEYVLFGAVMAWVLMALIQHRRTLTRAVDRELLLAAALFSLAALVLPDLHMNTIQFAKRWVPGALVLLLLALPAPALKPALQRVVSLSLIAVFCCATTLAWLRFDRTEFAGLEEALAVVPAKPRVIGLDYVHESPTVRGRPFMQAFAYTQVLRGGRLNMSFAGFAPSLVVFNRSRRVPWTVSLEWFPERVQRSDFEHFDYALINGEPEAHAFFAAIAELAPLTHSGRWRLYRVTSARG